MKLNELRQMIREEATKLDEYFTSRDVDGAIQKAEQELGKKLVFPDKVKRIAASIVKDDLGPWNKVDNALLIMTWMATANKDSMVWTWWKDHDSVMYKLMGGPLYGLASQYLISITAAVAAYSIINHIADKDANDEDIEPAYYECKNYFNSIGMSKGRSFDACVRLVDDWMKKHKLDR